LRYGARFACALAPEIRAFAGNNPNNAKDPRRFRAKKSALQQQHESYNGA
jgi:hypothetical protein